MTIYKFMVVYICKIKGFMDVYVILLYAGAIHTHTHGHSVIRSIRDMPEIQFMHIDLSMHRLMEV